MTASFDGVLQLLVLQGSPFCSLDCTCCYLPDRLNTSRMSMDVLRQSLASVLGGRMVGKELTIVWHAGEPLVTCGGGCPANKLGEHGSLRATLTAHCGLTKKALAEVVLEDLEHMLAVA